jgi:DNA-binding GntR family transcriptional regulator
VSLHVSPLKGAAAEAPTRSREVYERLRDAIVRGELRPNERLIEAELAAGLQVSRTPVRESLPRLAAEGLIVSRGRGWVVLEHSADEIREIYDVRAALEGYAALLAAERATPEQVEHICEIARSNPTEMGRLPVDEFVVVNERFHSAIIEAAGNKRLAQAIQQTRTYYFNQRIALVYSEREVVDAFAGHQLIAEAIRSRRGDEAERLTRAHVSEALDAAVHKL